MDLKLFDPKSVFMSNLIGQKEMLSFSTFNFKAGSLKLSPFISSYKVLDAFDDEYGGGVVNPEKLPSDTNVFVSILRSSLSLWRTEVKQH
ncbi:hypothetical protein Hanom_Chr13g01193441 [Helianthus anomalus]